MKNFGGRDPDSKATAIWKLLDADPDIKPAVACERLLADGLRVTPNNFKVERLRWRRAREERARKLAEEVRQKRKAEVNAWHEEQMDRFVRSERVSRQILG